MFGSLRDKKRQRVRGKKTLVKNLWAIDFLPSWSSPYHPALLHPHPSLTLSLLCCVVPFPGEVLLSGKWRRGLTGEVGFCAAKRPQVWRGFSARRPGRVDGLMRYRRQQQQQHTKRIFNKNKYDSQKSMKRERKKGKKTPQHPQYLKPKRQSPWKGGKQVSALMSHSSLSQGGEEEMQKFRHHGTELDWHDKKSQRICRINLQSSVFLAKYSVAVAVFPPPLSHLPKSSPCMTSFRVHWDSLKSRQPFHLASPVPSGQVQHSPLSCRSGA